jgi:hypothetical protein
VNFTAFLICVSALYLQLPGSKVGGPEICAAHMGQKVGGPRPARPNSFRRLCPSLAGRPCANDAAVSGSVFAEDHFSL